MCIARQRTGDIRRATVLRVGIARHDGISEGKGARNAIEAAAANSGRIDALVVLARHVLSDRYALQCDGASAIVQIDSAAVPEGAIAG